MENPEESFKFHLGYKCTEMNMHISGLSHIRAVLPNNVTFETRSWGVRERFRYFYHNSEPKMLKIRKSDCPIEISVFLVSGYIDTAVINPPLLLWRDTAMKVLIEADKLKSNLKAIYLITPPNEIEKIEVEYVYGEEK